MSERNIIIDNLLAGVQAMSEAQGIKNVIPYEENYLQRPKNETPLVMVYDTGTDEEIAYDDTDSQFVFPVMMVGYVVANDWPSTQSAINDLSRAIKGYIKSNPDLGDNFCAIHFREGRGLSTDGRNDRAVVAIRAEIIYWEPNLNE